MLKLKQFAHSAWFFPVVLLLPLFILTVLQISGSSIGVENQLFYGQVKDPHLLLNNPRPIRSDEWLVNSQITIAQQNNGFKRINPNIGKGEDVSLLVDVPYKDWSAIFKPHNWGFFVLPFNNAFAFHWWIMAYLLMVSCYVFIVSLMPDRKLFASLVSLALFFSPFIQWWYLYGTLGSIYYVLFAGAIFIKLLDENRLSRILLWGLLLTYVITCLAYIAYPPFQIACALVMFAFVLGYLMEKKGVISRRKLFIKMGVLLLSAAIAGMLTFIFLATRHDVVQTIQNTVYPGKRSQISGGFDAGHLFSSHLGAQLQFSSRAALYSLPGKGLINQSEDSNFILLLPFLLLPSALVIYKFYKMKNRVDWSLAVINVTFLFLLIWLFVPNLNLLGKLTFLSQVPHMRLVIGLGVLNILQLVLFVRCYAGLKNYVLSRSWAFLYMGCVLIIELCLGIYAMHRFPGFIGPYRIMAFSLPIPAMMYLLLRKRFELAAGIFFLFALLMTFHVNPLYRGTDVLEKTPLSSAIKSIASKDSSYWASEDFWTENFVYMNGAHSLSGVYTYPQLGLWQKYFPASQEDIYNRYAHINFSFDRDSTVTIPTTLQLIAPDHFMVKTEPCGNFLQTHKVHYLLTSSALSTGDACLSLARKINYPQITYYIYKLSY